MSEELYNSSDYCSLAEQYEELKKENAELARDKDYLMNLFMESSEYVFNVVANMEIESLTQKCKVLEADYEVSNREMLIIQVEIGRLKSELARRDEELALTEKKLCNIDRSARAEVARRDKIIARLKEDAERLAGKLISMYADEMYECSYCGHGVSKSPDEIEHAPDCPITLHRALIAELKKETEK